MKIDLDKSAFPTGDDFRGDGMTVREELWARFAEASLPIFIDRAMASGSEQEVQAVPQAACATADAMMAAIAEREGREDA